MADTAGSRDPTPSSLERGCRLVAVQAALVVAAVHLLWAVPRFSVSLLTTPVADSRPFLFVPAAFVLVAVAAALFRGYRYRRLSVLGGGTLAALFVGYVSWITGPLLVALSSEPLAAVSRIAELVGIAAFGLLYYLHHPDRQGSPIEASETTDQ